MLKNLSVRNSSKLINAGKLLFALLVTSIMILALIVISLRWLNPPTTAVIFSERTNLKDSFKIDWTPIESLGDNIALAVVASEDSNFCDHYGFDISEILKVTREGSMRGASTISQQVAKNLFLWRKRSWIRKGSEAFMTILIEIFWSKRRILEVYLNIAETGNGYFGVSSIAKKRFNMPSNRLSLKQASYIAVTLPNPKKRNATNLSERLKNQAKNVVIGATTLKIEGRASCFINK